jgi:diazepam-binding inhibitor (GABA receptor modulator, acyl-CoA-binding protein)
MNFSEAAKKVQTLSERPDDKTLLKLYGLYKQAVFGDCNIPQPWAIQVEARAKWDAWNSHLGKSKQQAEQEYVKLVEKLLKRDVDKLLKELGPNALK